MWVLCSKNIFSDFYSVEKKSIIKVTTELMSKFRGDTLTFLGGGGDKHDRFWQNTLIFSWFKCNEMPRKFWKYESCAECGFFFKRKYNLSFKSVMHFFWLFPGTSGFVQFPDCHQLQCVKLPDAKNLHFCHIYVGGQLSNEPFEKISKRIWPAIGKTLEVLGWKVFSRLVELGKKIDVKVSRDNDH